MVTLSQEAYRVAEGLTFFEIGESERERKWQEADHHDGRDDLTLKAV